MAKVVGKRAINAALRGLGTTVDEVASTLHHGGFKGHRGLPCTCPLSNFLFDLTGEEWSVTSVYARKTSDGPKMVVVLSQTIGDFISAFDAGQYPFLETR